MFQWTLNINIVSKLTTNNPGLIRVDYYQHGKWTHLQNVSTRSDFSSATFNNSVLLIGGRDENSTELVPSDGSPPSPTSYLYWRWQSAARSTAERVLLFTESTRVYGDYFVITEPCTVDTNTIWWNIHNYSKLTFICKYSCTAIGLELDVVLEEKLHGQLDMLSPER